MKKRLLSMLLLVAMVVTALPLVALPAVAAENEEKTYTAKEYNDLYVKSGLIYAVDFFGLNSYWNTEYTDIPVGPSENTAYEYNGVTYDLTKPENRMGYGLSNVSAKKWVSDTVYATQAEAEAALAAMPEADRAGVSVVERITHAFEKAYSEWMTADRAYYDQFIALSDFSANPGSPLFSHSYRPAFGPTYNAPTNKASLFVAKVFTAAEEHDGYITLRSDKHTSGGIQIANGHAHKAGGEVTQQLIAAFGGTLDNAFTIMMDARPSVKTTDGMTEIVGNAGNFSSTKFTSTGLKFANNASEVVDFTYSLKYAPSNAGVTVATTATGRTEDGLLFTDEGNYKVGGSLYFGWSTTAPTIKIYGYRQYAKILSQDEIEQNHFADLAKFYRLDLSRFEKLTAEEMTAVYKAAIPFDLGTADRALLADAVYTAAMNAMKARYEVYEGQIDAAILAVGAEYLLNLELILGIPRGALPATYTLLNSVAAGSYEGDDVAADYEAAIQADFAAYAATSTLTAKDYNALYTLDGLVYATDFYSTNAYWQGAPATYTDFSNSTTSAGTVAFRKAMAEFAWAGADSVSWGTDKKADAPGTATVQNGYINLQSAGNVSLNGIGALTGFGYAENGGATAEQVMKAVGGGFMFNNVRAFFSKSSYEASSFEVQSNLHRMVTAPKYNGAPVKTDAFLAPVSLAMVLSFNKPAYAVRWGASNITGSANSAAVYAYAAEWIEVDGERVISVAATTDSVAPFFQPSMRKVDEVLYQEGTKLETPLTDVFVYFPDEQATPGFFGLYENGATSYENAAVPYLNNNEAYDAAYVNWSSCTSDLYAVRYYNRALTAAELANNHFVDVAKFFRLNITGYDTLSAEDRATVAAALADVNFAADRVEAQSAILRALAPVTKASYDAMKGENAKINAFLDLAFDYSLDISAVLASSYDMSSVYETVTAAALAGKTMVEAQAILNEAYADAVCYFRYQVDDAKANAAAWNAMLADLAERFTAAAPVSVEGLIALPWSIRSTVQIPAEGTAAEVQAAIDAFAAAELAKFGDKPYIDYDYDALYVQNGLVFQTDFFKLNEYWNTEKVAYAAPVGPSENSAYLYNNGTPEDPSDDVTVDLTKTENRYGWGLVKGKAWVDDTVYATKEAAEAALATLGDAAVTVNERATHAFYAAWEDWWKADKAFLAQFGVIPDSKIYMFSYQPPLGADKNNASYNIASLNTAKSYSAYTVGNGYLRLRDDLHSSGGLQYAGTNTYATDNLSVQFTATLGGAEKTNTTLLITNNVRPYYTTLAGRLSITGISASNFAINGGVTSNFSVKSTETDVVSMTVTLEGMVNESESDRVVVRTEDGVMATINGKLTLDANAHNNHYLSYGNATAGMRLYALRYYNVALSETDLLKNHFADLAKFYRLDLTLLSSLSAAQVEKVYETFAEYDIGTTDRASLQAAFDSIAAEIYGGIELVEDAAANALFLKIAAAGALDVARIKNLSAEGRETIVSAILEELVPATTISKAVVNKLYDDLTYSLGALTFAGYQVRIDTGAASQNYAGVRAVFDVDKEIVKALAADGAVTLTVAISLDGAVGSTIEITYDAETDALKGVMTTGDVTEDVIFYERDGKTSFNYTVVYKKAAPTAEQLAAEYAYAYTIKAGKTTIDFAVKSDTFGETVSAFELYDYFSKLPEYAADRVVADVLALAD